MEKTKKNIDFGVQLNYTQENTNLSLEYIDSKKTIKFFDHVTLSEDLGFARPLKLGNGDVIWKIEDFLTKDECEILVNVCESTGFESIGHIYNTDFRDSKRILAFDENQCLIETLQNRLNNDCFLERLYKRKWKKPYGFYSEKSKCKPNSIDINPCIRFNKYDKNSKGFGWHRDAQYTQNHKIRSNYTLVVYLTDNDDGAINFIAPKYDFIHEGHTVEEEMNSIKKFRKLKINPKQGMALIFDQRLLHKADPCINPKYVLRTDLLCHIENNLELKKDVERLQSLTQKLFRQAQYYELNSNIDMAQELYERCLSLRQNPHRIKKFPIHLEKLLVDISVQCDLINQESVMRLISRSGHKYVYDYTMGY
jgi:hypothetical protein